MHLELMRERGRAFPKVAEPLAVRSARVWHCKDTSLAGLGSLTNLETLVIASYPDESFVPLTRLRRLRYLSVLHFPNAVDLSPIKHFRKLETLSLASLPSWDASGKVIVVESLEPIGSLAKTQAPRAVRRCTRRESACSELRQLPSLQSARFSNNPKSEISSFYERTGVSDAFAPEPTFDD